MDARSWYVADVCVKYRHEHAQGDGPAVDCIIQSLCAAVKEAKKLAPDARAMDWFHDAICETQRHRHPKARTFECFLLWGAMLRDQAAGGERIARAFATLPRR